MASKQLFRVYPKTGGELADCPRVGLDLITLDAHYSGDAHTRLVSQLLLSE